MRIDDILDRLRLLGLDEVEAQVYLHLARVGPSKASDVAAAVRTPRTDAYRTLTNLVQRGFVLAGFGRPALYEARPVEDVFRDVHLGEQARLDNILRIQHEVGHAIRALAPAAGDAPANGARNVFRAMQGRRDAYRALERMLLEAERVVRVVSTYGAAVALSEPAGTLDAALRCAERGVRVEVVISPESAALPRLRAAEGPNVRVRESTGPRRARFVLVDERELLAWVVNDPSTRLFAEDDVSLWSTAPDFVATYEWMFQLAWADAARPVRSVPVLEDVDYATADEREA